MTEQDTARADFVECIHVDLGPGQTAMMKEPRNGWYAKDGEPPAQTAAPDVDAEPQPPALVEVTHPDLPGQTALMVEPRNGWQELGGSTELGEVADPDAPPARNATTEAWAEWVVRTGRGSEEDVAGLGRDELIALFDPATN